MTTIKKINILLLFCIIFVISWFLPLYADIVVWFNFLRADDLIMYKDLYEVNFPFIMILYYIPFQLSQLFPHIPIMFLITVESYLIYYFLTFILFKLENNVNNLIILGLILFFGSFGTI